MWVKIKTNILKTIYEYRNGYVMSMRIVKGNFITECHRKKGSENLH